MTQCKGHEEYEAKGLLYHVEAGFNGLCMDVLIAVSDLSCIIFHILAPCKGWSLLRRVSAEKLASRALQGFLFTKSQQLMLRASQLLLPGFSSGFHYRILI